MAANAFASLLNRKNSSIFANNPKVGLANFIDPLPMTLVEFGRHWLRASVAVGRKEVRDAINRLPVVPQADLNFNRDGAAKAALCQASFNKHFLKRA